MPQETKKHAVAIVFSDDTSKTFACESGECFSPFILFFRAEEREKYLFLECFFSCMCMCTSVELGLRGIVCEMFVKMWTKIQKREAESKGERLKKVVELELSQTVLICRYIKKWEGLFRNIDFHTAGMKNDIGHIIWSVFQSNYGL